LRQRLKSLILLRAFERSGVAFSLVSFFWRSTNALAFERLCRPEGSMPQALIKERNSPKAKAFYNQPVASE